MLFHCGGVLDRQIGMEPLVIDSAKEEAKMAKIIRHLCLLLVINFLSRLCNIFLARSNALKECYLVMNFQKKIVLPFLRYP